MPPRFRRRGDGIVIGGVRLFVKEGGHGQQ
jgi:hypothetical protein